MHFIISFPSFSSASSLLGVALAVVVVVLAESSYPLPDTDTQSETVLHWQRRPGLRHGSATDMRLNMSQTFFND